jgi:hypothetical protein
MVRCFGVRLWSRADSSFSPMPSLILKRASASRSSGEWNDNDLDVLADGAVVGRIFPAGAAPVARRGCGRCFTVTARTHATWAGYVPPPCQI